MKKLLIAILSVVLCVLASALFPSCIEDSFTDSPSDQPGFSVDTLKLGTVFTEEMTVTHRFSVRNPASKSLLISRIALSGEYARYFRLNVDGFSGRDFANVEIRGRDSIFVLVEATLPPAGRDLPSEMNAHVDFTTNGVTRSVVLNALGQDVERLKALCVSTDMTLDSPKPYQIFDSLVVEPSATLRLAPGTRLCFHDKASLIVRGTLISDGTVDDPVILSGDRTGNVVTDISFDLMSRQWEGVRFCSGSSDNILRNTIIKNTVNGVLIDGSETPDVQTSLTMINSRLRNSGGLVLDAVHADVTAVGCEFAEGGAGLVRLQGGNHRFSQSTFANYYLFAAIGGPAITFDHFSYDTEDETGLPLMSARIDNSIIYGLGSDLSHGDLTGSDILIRNCLLKSRGTDDDNFISCVWESNPLYYTVRNEYFFDYRLHDDSPAIGVGDPELIGPDGSRDGYGLDRGLTPDLGAYVYTPEEKE